MQTIEVDAKKIMNKVTLCVKLKRSRQSELRIKIGIWLIKLAALIMWIQLEISFDNYCNDTVYNTTNCTGKRNSKCNT